MKHPYADAPAYRRWSRAVAAVPPADVDPVVSMPFRISPSEQIVTAGSCFAQHIARHLRQNGFGFLVTEAAHPLVPAETAEALNYGVYSARYGNVYTARQMLQLLRRVRGQFRPADDVWERSGAAVISILSGPPSSRMASPRFVNSDSIESNISRRFCVPFRTWMF